MELNYMMLFYVVLGTIVYGYFMDLRNNQPNWFMGRIVVVIAVQIIADFYGLV